MLSGERTKSSFFSKLKPNSLKIFTASTPKEGAQERPGDLIPAKLMKFLTSLDSPITKSSNPAIVALSPEKLRMFSLKFIEGTLSPQRIIEQLSVYSGKKIQPADTLLIFDEVQEMPRALTSLKYFAEEAPEYAICCAGSLLGVALHEGTSFPVGKVEFLDLYPLSFREFLLANGEEMLLDYILNDGHRDLAAFTEKLTDYLKKYFVIGGMPSAVLKWLDTHDFFEVDDVQKQLVAAYENDFSKHAPRQMIEKIRYVWDSIPSQLAKENKKFVYGLVREGARAREYEDSLMWLSDAGEIIRTYNISKPDVPLKAYADLKSFKVFLLDVGLLILLRRDPH